MSTDNPEEIQDVKSDSIEKILSDKFAELETKLTAKFTEYDKNSEKYRKAINDEQKALRQELKKVVVVDEDPQPKEPPKSDSEEEIAKKLRMADKWRLNDAREALIDTFGSVSREDDLYLFKLLRKSNDDAEFEEHVKDFVTKKKDKIKQDAEEAQKKLAEIQDKENKKSQAKTPLSPDREPPGGKKPDEKSINEQIEATRKELNRLIVEGKSSSLEADELREKLKNF